MSVHWLAASNMSPAGTRTPKVFLIMPAPLRNAFIRQRWLPCWPGMKRRRTRGAAAVIHGGQAVAGWGYLRTREPASVRALRAAHTGSVNDYAAFAAAGLVAVVAALTPI
jgi:hypothetical protein